MNIKDKVIIITGASMGIGEATARELSKKGAHVVLAARTKDKLEKLSEQLPGSFVVVTDMSDADSIKNLITQTVNKFGRVDVLINNAGQGLYSPIEHVKVEEYRKIIELNVIGPLIAMQEVIPVLRKQGGGMIVNISSMVSKNYYPYLGTYASTKYALNALSLTARAELEKEHIIVSVMHPGLTATEFGKNSMKTEEAKKMLEARINDASMQADSAEYIAGRIALTIETGEAEVYAHDEQKPL